MSDFGQPMTVSIPIGDMSVFWPYNVLPKQPEDILETISLKGSANSAVVGLQGTADQDE